MPNPTTAAEWAGFLEDWATLPSGVSPQDMAEMVCAHARQQVEAALERAEKALCRFCRKGLKITLDHENRPCHVLVGEAMNGEDLWWPCDAAAIRGEGRDARP